MAKTKHPPAHWLHQRVEKYWFQGKTDTAMSGLIRQDIAKEAEFRGCNYSMSTRGIYRVREKLGLMGTRQAKNSGAHNSIPDLIRGLRPAYPNMGAREMVNLLRQEHQIKISEPELLKIFHEIEPEAVRSRKGVRFKRSRFYSAGVMEIFSFDQHDKWKRFGLWLHLCTDPYTGVLHWLKIYWTNRNTALVTSYYLEAVRRQQAVPLLTFSDTGRENNGIAKCHTTIRHRIDPTLVGTIQHKWFYDTMNIKSEISWSRMRRGFATGFENLLNRGELDGIVDFGRLDPIETYLIRWLFIPFLQAELDRWTNQQNNSRRRAYKHKILPHGIPNEIHESPERFGGRNYAVPVSNELLDEMQAIWSPPDNPVFELTCPSFEDCAHKFYADLGSPTIDYSSVWHIFVQMRQMFENDVDENSRSVIHSQFESQRELFGQDVEIPDSGVPDEERVADDRLWSTDEDSSEEEIEYEIEVTDDEGDQEEAEEIDTYLCGNASA